MKVIIFSVLFIISIPVALFLIFKPVVEDRKLRNNVNNSDPLSQHYSFELSCTQQAAIEQLSLRNVHDVLAYSFDVDSLTIIFTHFTASIEHRLFFYTVENQTFLKVSRVKLLHEKSNIPLMINRFFIEKIAAVPIDYRAFEATVGTITNEDAPSSCDCAQ